MIDSRQLQDLNVATFSRANLFISACGANGVTVFITSTYRDVEMQDHLYAFGRLITDHPKVTNARGGFSFHQYRCAFDAYPLIGGKPLWTVFDPHGKLLMPWQVMKDAAASVGLEWAGNWASFKEYAHFQFTAGKTLADFRRTV